MKTKQIKEILKEIKSNHDLLMKDALVNYINEQKQICIEKTNLINHNYDQRRITSVERKELITELWEAHASNISSLLCSVALDK